MNTIKRLEASTLNQLTSEEMLAQVKKLEACLPGTWNAGTWSLLDEDEFEELGVHGAIRSDFFRMVCTGHDVENTTLLGKTVQKEIVFELEWIGDDYFGPTFDEKYSSVENALFDAWAYFQRTAYRHNVTMVNQREFIEKAGK